MKNFKVRCVEPGYGFEKEKLYEVKDGFLETDDGIKIGSGMLNLTPFENVEEINFDLEAQFELVEEEKKTPFQYLIEYYDIKLGEVFKINGIKVYFDENKVLRYEDGCPAHCYMTLIHEPSKVEKLPWKPKNGDEVLIILSDGYIYEHLFEESLPSDVALLKLGWIFPTKEEAERNKDRVLAEMKEVLNGKTY